MNGRRRPPRGPNQHPHPFQPGPPDPNVVPLIGQQQAQQRAGVMQLVGQMGLNIYTATAIQYLQRLDDHEQADREHLRQLARDANAAGKAYFEGLKIAEFEPEPGIDDTPQIQTGEC